MKKNIVLRCLVLKYFWEVIMFFVNQNGNSLLIKPYLNSSINLDKGQIQILESVKQFTVVGKSSIFDSNYTQYTNCNTITFSGTPFFNFPEYMSIAVYELSEGSGYIFHDQKKQVAFASRSLSLLNDYTFAFGQSLIGYFKEAERSTIIEPFFINDNLNTSFEEPTSEDHLIFDLNWNENSFLHFPFKMIIERDTYNKTSDMFATTYTGFALGLGSFTQYIIKGQDDPDKVYPEYFPEKKLNYCVIFDNLVDDNAEHILSPNIMLIDEYRTMLKEAKKNGRNSILFNGFSKFGYSVSAQISILPESESIDGYEAKVTKLVLSPVPFLESNFLFKE